MKAKSRAAVILTILFGYVLLQFLWWEILLVKQNGRIINETQKLMELASTDEAKLREDIADLHKKKQMQTVMIVSEGTVFLLLLLFGLYKIKQAQDKETNLTRQQNNFFLSITHELKTPIAATKLQLQTLQKQRLDARTQQELISNALVETDRLNMLIDNVLLASRLNTGEFIIHKTAQDLGEAVTAILNRYYKKQLGAGNLVMTLEPGLRAEIDAHAITSVITNLVDNALKYSPGNPRVEVSLIQQKGEILLSVTDEGQGISEADQQKIFGKFYRGGHEETRKAKGTGLGLFIVDHLVKKHAGRISVKPNKPNGSIFEVRINAA
jgi:K+-sensing histidine kinase KdpD